MQPGGFRRALRDARHALFIAAVILPAACSGAAGSGTDRADGPTTVRTTSTSQAPTTTTASAASDRVTVAGQLAMSR
jgi:hypothetical protein